MARARATPPGVPIQRQIRPSRRGLGAAVLLLGLLAAGCTGSVRGGADRAEPGVAPTDTGAWQAGVLPGETRTVRFRLGPEDLAFYDQQMRRVVEPGSFTVWVGASSRDERQRARFEVIGEVHRLRP